MKIQVGIIGAAGLSGLELIRCLSQHPSVQLNIITSSKYQGQSVSEAFPHLRNCSLTFSSNDADVSECDVVFLAIPNQASLSKVPFLMKQDLKIIDLSGVYRLKDRTTFEKYYRLTHTSPELLNQAVYGLPELFRQEIVQASLVANPGCYATGALLGLLPFGELLKELQTPPMIDAKSGVSGAGGRVEHDSVNYIEVNENFKAYKVFQHQHHPEIQQYLELATSFSSEQQGELMFTPHLLPVNRGILSSIYLIFKKPLAPQSVRKAFETFAQQNPFVHVLAQDQVPDLKSSVGSNRCMIGITHDEHFKHWIIISSLDNLLKGASGQAIQNMNLMFGLPETMGLLIR